VATAYVAPGAYRRSGLTRSVHRGADYRAADALGRLVSVAAHAIREGERSYVTVYHGDLDLTGHICGSDSPDWRHHLAFVDLLAQRLAGAMPPEAVFYITADHGMIDPDVRVDVDADPDLRAGVALLGGEPRARHVYTEDGAAADVLTAWRERLGGRAWVLSREEAIEEGLFGPVAAPMVARVGDVVAVARDKVAIVATEAEPGASALAGMHGSLSAAEQLVPLISPTPVP
jgi:hypothetical protein